MCEEEIKNSENCCPEFDPKPWDNITHLWNEKLFIKDTVPQLFHIPLPGFVNKVIKRLWSKAQSSGAAPELKDFLLLAYDPSPWKSEFHLAVNKEVPGANNIKLSGKFISKVFDGPFNAIPQFIKEMDTKLSAEQMEAKRYFFYFTTCPKCAKKYGHNYIVAFAEI